MIGFLSLKCVLLLLPNLNAETNRSNASLSTCTFPEPFVEKVEGWKVEFGPELMAEQQKKTYRECRKSLANHLQRIRYLLPEEKSKALQRFIIKVDLDHDLSNMQYHPSRLWLIEHGHDPKLEKRVHVPRARLLLDRATWLKHPYVILHELAHAYHDQVLDFANPTIIEAYKRAKKRSLYQKVLFFRGGTTSHYAQTNHMEFFAEMTESYVGVNDFYPFVRAELKEHDPHTFDLMQEIWGEF